LAGAVALFVLMLANERLTRGPMAKLGAQANQSHMATEELYQNAELITALGMRRRMRDRWMSQHDQTLVDGLQVADRNSAVSNVTKASRLILQSAILAVGAYLVINQEILPGVMIAASIIFARAVAPVEQTIAHWRNVLSARRSWDRLRTLMTHTDLPGEPPRLPDPKGFISAEDVTLVAKGRNDPLLAGIRFDLRPGEALGVLGSTGAGKSTLGKVLIGALTPQKGKVTIDGAALDQWDRDRLGAHVGYLTQDAEMFTGTVAENISRFDPDADMGKITDAAKLAELHQFILDLPNGYATPIGPSGHPFSGGERQRIGLARAVYGNPAIVILDEPNANLDAPGETAVIECIKRLKKQETAVIVIAHRPSAIQAVDKVLYLRGGRQEAFGPRDEVLRKILVNANDGATPIRPAPPQPEPARAADAAGSMRPSSDDLAERKAARAARREQRRSALRTQSPSVSFSPLVEGAPGATTSDVDADDTETDADLSQRERKTS
ncbi:MAG: ATP-binding cassette domain-containing protein, partial [Pseudomonadota bacterium]